jgi:hypothetical protein
MIIENYCILLYIIVYIYTIYCCILLYTFACDLDARPDPIRSNPAFLLQLRGMKLQ